jgi:hypothetical protein
VDLRKDGFFLGDDNEEFPDRLFHDLVYNFFLFIYGKNSILPPFIGCKFTMAYAIHHQRCCDVTGYFFVLALFSKAFSYSSPNNGMTGELEKM